MELNDIYIFLYGLIFIHPFISMGVVAVLGIIIYLKPKEIIKVTALFVGILIVVYVLSYLTGATKTGFIKEGKLVNKSIDEDEKEKD
jgi:hypothetical protein